MTAKRFYYAHGIIFDTHKDNHVNKIGTIKDLDTGLRIVDWLNVLHEENQRVKGVLQGHYDFAKNKKSNCEPNDLVCFHTYRVLKATIKEIADELGVDLND